MSPPPQPRPPTPSRTTARRSSRPPCRRDDVAVGDLAARHILTKTINSLMHLGHEFVEVRAAPVGDRALLKKHVHQHGLAAPDFPVDVKPSRRRLALVRKQPAQQTLLAR